MALSFKYRKEKFNEGYRYYPKIPVYLHNKSFNIETAVLLDSGATDIFIPRQIAEVLSLELKNEDFADGWNGKFKVWESKIGVVVGKGSQTFRAVLPCVVPDELGEEQEIIFGRSFFEFFWNNLQRIQKNDDFKENTKLSRKRDDNKLAPFIFVQTKTDLIPSSHFYKCDLWCS